MKWIQELIPKFSRERRASVQADKGSLATAGDIKAPVSIFNAPVNIGVDSEQVHALLIEHGNKIHTAINDKLQSIVEISDKTLINDAIDAQLDARIDELGELIKKREIKIALELFEKLLEKEASKASSRILFRIKANIGICKFLLGQETQGANLLIEAYAYAPEEPKAISNRMIGLMLLDKVEEALSFGQESLKQDQQNEALAGYVIQASRFSDDITEPLSLVPENLHNTASVLIGYIVFLRHRNNKEWWNIASTALASYPNDEHIKLCAAQAILDEITCSIDFQQYRQLSGEQKRKVQEPAVNLQELWDKAFIGDKYFTSDDLSSGCNLLLAYHLLNKPKDIKRICNQIIEHQIEEETLLEYVAKVSITHNLLDITEQVISKLPSKPQTTLLKFQFNTEKNNWSEISNISKEDIDELPPSEQPMILTAVSLAKLKIQGNIELNDVNSIFEEVKHDARACIAIASLVEGPEFEDIANQAYETALGLINTQSDLSSRLMVASHSFNKMEWQNVIHLLNEYIDITSDSYELRNLTLSFINSSPIQEKAVKFFEGLSIELLENDFYIWASGLFYFRYKKWDTAESWLTKSIERNKYDLSTFSALVDIYSKDRSEKAVELISCVDIANMKGHPIEKIHFAYQLKEHGKKKDSLEYFYQLQKNYPKIPQVVLGYFNFILLAEEKLIPDITSVEVDCWVSLVNQNGDTANFIICDEPSPKGDDEYGLSHYFSKNSLGLKVGESFSQSRHIGGDITWTIAEIKHKYIHAWHKIMQNFEQKFPDFHGLYQIKVINNDMSPVLEMIKLSSERIREVANLYLDKQVPLALVAGVAGRDVISFSEYIYSLGEDIRACIGTADESEIAENLILNKKSDSVVLDAYTAWIVSKLDIFEILKSIFGKLLISQSAINEIKSFEEKNIFDDGSVINDSQLRERIEGNCHILPVAAPDDIDSDLINYGNSLDSIYLAKKENSFLLSEDLYYRQLFFNMTNSPLSVWLQPLITYALVRGIINKKNYAEIILQLAPYRHVHLSISADILLTILDNDKTDKLIEFAKVAYFIGGKNADIDSHLYVVNSFLSVLWKNSPVDLKTKKATGILLENFFRVTQWAEAFVLLLHKNYALVGLRNYLLRWREGHFLPQPKLVEVLSDKPK